MTDPAVDRHRLKDLDAQLVFTLQKQAVDAVIDVNTINTRDAKRDGAPEGEKARGKKPPKDPEEA